MNEKKVLVTGGCGFIGSELVFQLASAGYHVVVLDNFATGKIENLKGLPEKRFTLVEGDVRDSSLLAKILPSVSKVFHLACLGIRHSIEAPEETHDVDATGTLRLLEAARRARMERFIYVSSSEVYGTAIRVPIDESHPTFPTTPYGASKLAAEAYARAFFRSYGLPVAIVRPFNAYGPRSHHEGDSGEVIPRFLLRLLANRPLMIFGDGEQTRDFTFVEDTARAILLAAQNEDAVGRTLNIGSGKEISINELALILAEVVGVSSPVVVHDEPRPGDIHRLLASYESARELLGFTPQIKLREGLKRLFTWYRGLGVSPQKLLEDEVLYNWRQAFAIGPIHAHAVPHL